MGQGRLLGLLPHGSTGCGTADLPPWCPVMPGTGVLQVCSASSTVSVAVLGAELQAQGAKPSEVLVLAVQEQGLHSEVPQSCSTSPSLLVLEGLPPCQGTALLHSPGSTSQDTRSHLHMYPLCAKARFASSSPAAEDSTRGTEGRAVPAPTCHRQILSKKKT